MIQLWEDDAMLPHHFLPRSQPSRLFSKLSGPWLPLSASGPYLRHSDAVYQFISRWFNQIEWLKLTRFDRFLRMPLLMNLAATLDLTGAAFFRDFAGVAVFAGVTAFFKGELLTWGRLRGFRVEAAVGARERRADAFAILIVDRFRKIVL